MSFLADTNYGHGNCGNDYNHGCEYEGGYGRSCGYGRESECECGCCDYCCGHEHHHKHEFHHHHHHGHDHMHGDNLYWVNKIRNMSEEEFTEFKNKREMGYGNWGRNSENYRKCQFGEKSEAECDCDSNSKKEETTK